MKTVKKVGLWTILVIGIIIKIPIVIFALVALTLQELCTKSLVRVAFELDDEDVNDIVAGGLDLNIKQHEYAIYACENMKEEL